MKKNIKKGLFYSFICLVLMTICFSCSSSGLDNSSDDKSSTIISVSGTGTVNLEADMVSFYISVSETARTTGEAQQNTNKKISQILSILRKNNIEDKDISTDSLNFNTVYHWENNERIKDGEQVNQSLYVKLKDINKFGSIADELGTSVSGISLYSVSFGVQDNSQAIISARKLAYEDAQKKAETYAKSASLMLSSPVSITEGYSTTSTKRSYMEETIALTASNDTASFYETETPSGTLSVTVNTNVTFEAYSIE